jgi:3-deoxy-7-phosphoheptulonate synthase
LESHRRLEKGPMKQTKSDSGTVQEAQGKTSDVRIVSFEPLDPPETLKRELPLTEKAAENVLMGRDALRRALHGQDSRFVVILGPCSIHDPGAAIEYAQKLKHLNDEVSSTLLLVMRVYFEKPRTTVGWKGLINDPRLDGSGDINLGLRKAREILLAINELGLSCATEFLDPIVPQYTADLVSWAAIGARTTESQTHREMASGLSMPVGFKNSTDGDLQTAMDAMVSARHPHAFLGIDPEGTTAIVRTKGNLDVHLVLRGGSGKPNYSPAHIAYTRVALGASAERRVILVDCSHGNSNKDYRRQPQVLQELVRQVAAGERSLLGAMLESHLFEGNQKMGPEMKYGVSITDGCISWETTAQELRQAARLLRGK